MIVGPLVGRTEDGANVGDVGPKVGDTDGTNVGKLEVGMKVG